MSGVKVFLFLVLNIAAALGLFTMGMWLVESTIETR